MIFISKKEQEELDDMLTEAYRKHEKKKRKK